ncbi:MAG: hypothetical protein ABIT07_08280 [Ferruginibacter sp.]
MKKFFTLTVLAVVILTSCKKDASLSQSEAAVSPLLLKADDATNSSAATPVTIFRWDFTGNTLFNDCTGQNMVCTQGTAQLQQRFGGVQGGLTFNTKDIIWQSADGTIYRGTGSPLVFSIPHQTDQYGIQNYTINYQGILTTAGGGNNLVIHELIHITVNNNQVTTAFLDNLSVGCQ